MISRVDPARGRLGEARSLTMYPDFLVIGAQKAGTTWLHRNLQAHPGIWMPKREVHYFDRKIKDDSFDDGWYASLFEPAEEGKTVGEYTPSYSVIDRDMVARVHELMPEAKIVLMMRNPIERAWSQAVMMRSKKKEEEAQNVLEQKPPKRPLRRFYNRFGRVPFQKLLALVARMPEEAPLRRFGKVVYGRLFVVFRGLNKLSRGRLNKRFGREKSLLRTNYLRTLDNWGTYYPPEQIFVGFLEDVHFRPETFLRDVYGFLNVDPAFRPPKMNEKINSRSTDEMPTQVASSLARTYEDSSRLLEQRFGGYASFWRYCTERLIENPPAGESVTYPLWDSTLREDWLESPEGDPEMFGGGRLHSGPLSSIQSPR
jgi:hypothetical protein